MATRTQQGPATKAGVAAAKKIKDEQVGRAAGSREGDPRPDPDQDAKPAGKRAAAPSSGGAVAVRRSGAVSTQLAASFEEDAGEGLKHIDADSVAIPFIAVLQKNSPQCDPDQGEYMKQAKPGMLFNTVTRKLYDGKEGVAFIPCNYMRKFLQWAPREVGGGFKGEHSPEAVVKMRDQGILVEMENRLYVPDDNGNVNPKKQDKVADTRVHYILVLDEETGIAQQAVLSLASTQIKKSKQLNSIISNVVFDRADGSGQYTPASYANVYRLTTVPESNEKGNWSGVKIDLESRVEDAATYQMAKAFSRLVESGRATVNYESARGVGGDDDSGGGEDEPRRGGGGRRF